MGGLHLNCGGRTDRFISTHIHILFMAEHKRRCPKCNAGNTYVLKDGKVVCRSCGYDERKIPQK